MRFDAIAVERLSHRWLSRNRPPTVALSHVECEFPAGKVTAIVGPSGCGKSTLLLILRGLIAPSEGAVRFLYARADGARVAGAPQTMATVWQSFNLLPWRTVIDNVAFGLEVAGLPKDERHARAQEAIRAVELAGFERHFPSQLSGGMRQRVGLARGLVMSPDVLFLDEPLGSLDAQTRLYLQEQLSVLVEQSGKTVILVTHNIDEAIFLSDYVLVMTARPGTVAARFTNDLGRPRTIGMQNERRFGELFREIYALLRDEVRKAMLN